MGHTGAGMLQRLQPLRLERALQLGVASAMQLRTDASINESRVTASTVEVPCCTGTQPRSRKPS
eukprot:1203337-Amphidinium_carterae.1